MTFDKGTEVDEFSGEVQNISNRVGANISNRVGADSCPWACTQGVVSPIREFARVFQQLLRLLSSYPFLHVRART